MKSTDSKNRPNYRKKQDTRNKTEVWQNTEVPVLPPAESQDVPVLSRLRRVVDMSAMQPARPKKTEGNKKTARKDAPTKKTMTEGENAPKLERKTSPDGAVKGVKGRKGRPERFVQKQTQPVDIVAENVIEHQQASSHVSESALAVESHAEKMQTSHVSEPICAPEGHEETKEKREKVRPVKSKKTQSLPKKRREQVQNEPESAAVTESAPIQVADEGQEHRLTPSSGESNTQEMTFSESQVRKVRTAKAIKPKMHISERHAGVRKDRVIKAPRLLARQHHVDTEARRAEVEECVNTILESLMLTSWRARQWVTNILALGPEIEGVLQRSMPMVQARFVNNMCIDGGRLESTVVEQVASVGLRQFTGGQWRAVVNGLSDRAIFTTSLLNGELPEGILEVFKQASLSLFPTKSKEFEFYCDCGAHQMPCEHVCALLLAFAQALEEDPFHILALRGMTRDNLLAFLRDARSDQVVDEKTRHRINYELPAQNVEFDTFCTPKGSFDELKFHIAYEPNTLVRRLGNPSVWQGPMSLEAAVMPMIELAAREAENLALGEPYVILADPNARGNAPSGLSRAPKSSSRAPRFKMPDMRFVLTALTPEILETVPDDPVSTAEDIIRWLKTRGASDIRTLARRTRLHKPTIEAFLNAFCDAGLTLREGEEDKMRFVAIF